MLGTMPENGSSLGSGPHHRSRDTCADSPSPRAPDIVRGPPVRMQITRLKTAQHTQHTLAVDLRTSGGRISRGKPFVSCFVEEHRFGSQKNVGAIPALLALWPVANSLASQSLFPHVRKLTLLILRHGRSKWGLTHLSTWRLACAAVFMYIY